MRNADRCVLCVAQGLVRRAEVVDYNSYGPYLWKYCREDNYAHHGVETSCLDFVVSLSEEDATPIEWYEKYRNFVSVATNTSGEALHELQAWLELIVD